MACLMQKQKTNEFLSGRYINELLTIGKNIGL